MSGDVLTVLTVGGNAVVTAYLIVMGALFTCLLGCTALFVLLALGGTVRQDAGITHLVIQPPEPGIGDDTIAMLCPCCNGAPFPAASDCICTDDCGNPRCQAADPEGVRNG